jgi:RNA polymerase sigma factor (sigma-70 family)
MKGANTSVGRAPTVEEVYERHTALLLSALRRLVDRGYQIDPTSGLELVHDFYVEALPGILERYEPKQASFTTYLYGAFLRFARPRLVRGARAAAILVPFDERIHQLHASSSENADDRVSALVDSVGDALRTLPLASQRILRWRLEGSSERAIAKRLQVSRYVVRQRVAEALGRLTVALHEDRAVPPDVRELAVRLWRNGEPLMSVAAAAGWSRQEAQERYRQLLRSLSDAAGALPPGRRAKGHDHD